MKNWLLKKEVKMKNAAERILKNEKGDTNFISILIILGIVIIVAGVFIGFKDKIVTMVSDIVGGFTLNN